MELLIVLRRASFPNHFQMAIGMCCTCSLSERVLIFLTHSLSVSYWPRLTLHDTEPVTRDLTQATLDSIFSMKQLTIIPPMEGKTHWISLQIDLHQQVTLKPRCYCHSDCSCHWFRVGVVIVLRLCGAGVSPCQTGDWLSEDTRLPGGQRIEAREGRCGTSTEDTLWVKCNTLTQPHVQSVGLTLKIMKLTVSHIVKVWIRPRGNSWRL